MSPLKEINQQAYYNAINRSTDAVNSGIFIDFMLQEIYETLKKRQGDPIVTMKATKDVGINVGINEQKVLELLRKNNQITAKEITGLLGISLRHSERLITSLKQKGMIQLSGNLADPQCADKECQFCRLLPDCCLLFFTGQSFVLLAYAVGWP